MVKSWHMPAETLERSGIALVSRKVVSLSAKYIE
jgi:hypothetical protein